MKRVRDPGLALALSAVRNRSRFAQYSGAGIGIPLPRLDTADTGYLTHQYANTPPTSA